jgi:lipid II:glycine glycyltransferase (peptidoglycan interpeptide bridge formation enzyme)
MSESTSFLQSKAWEQFQHASGKKTTRVDGALIIEYTTPLGSYYYAPRPNVTATTFQALVDHGRESGAMFIRIDPETTTDGFPGAVQKVPATAPQDSLLLHLKPTEELLAGFHEKTRYNIRLAERKGVTVTESAEPDSKELQAFIALSTGTAERQAFRYHPANYYQMMLKTLGPANDENVTVSVLVAWQGETPVAALIALWTPSIAYYLHGASSYEHRSLMAPHLLQFKTMEQALSRGCARYDFWGIAPDGAPDSHPWAGVTRFKLGFGGQRTHHPDSFAIVLKSIQYQLYLVARGIRRGV